MNQSITCVIITFNEEHRIEACLKSVQEVADEIIVVDSFSTDGTASVCERFEKVRVIQQKWLGYSEQKNLGISMACHPYILSIDSDEVLSPKLIESIKKEKQRGLTGAYSFNRLTFYRSTPIRHCGWYPDSKIRLWQGDAARWAGDVHEELKFTNKVVETHLKGDLLHFSFSGIDELLKKMISYTTIYANQKKPQSTLTIVGKIIFSPLFTFFRMYFLKLGFLDGLAGFKISCISAFYNFVKYAKIHELGSK